jgi:hypothetical protein
MPSFRDVANDVFCVHIVIDPGQVVWSDMAGGMDRPSRRESHPAGSLSSSQPGGPPCWSSILQPSAPLDVIDTGDGPKVAITHTSMKLHKCRL